MGRYKLRLIPVKHVYQIISPAPVRGWLQLRQTDWLAAGPAGALVALAVSGDKHAAAVTAAGALLTWGQAASSTSQAPSLTWSALGQGAWVRGCERPRAVPGLQRTRIIRVRTPQPRPCRTNSPPPNPLQHGHHT
eukprot:9333805-Pyramimonas_sp.AAC.2